MLLITSKRKASTNWLAPYTRDIVAHGTRNPRGRPGFRVGLLSESSSVFEDLVSSHFWCVSIFLRLVLLQMTPWSQQMQASQLCPAYTTSTRTRECLCVPEFLTVSWGLCPLGPPWSKHCGQGRVACQVRLPPRAGSGCVSAFWARWPLTSRGGGKWTFRGWLQSPLPSHLGGPFLPTLLFQVCQFLLFLDFSD